MNWSKSWSNFCDSDRIAPSPSRSDGSEVLHPSSSVIGELPKRSATKIKRIITHFHARSRSWEINK
ncbi:hypothetical protein YC2023_117809 [Brassica napus]